VGYNFMRFLSYELTRPYNASLIQVQEARDNIFDTDLKPTTTEHFAADYAKTTIVRDDKYIAGTAFRPSYNSLWDTNLPYSQGIEALNTPLFGERHHGYATAPTGAGRLGDILYNVAPKAGGYIGWVCVPDTLHPPHTTWQEFGPIKPEL